MLASLRNSGILLKAINNTICTWPYTNILEEMAKTSELLVGPQGYHNLKPLNKKDVARLPTAPDLERVVGIAGNDFSTGSRRSRGINEKIPTKLFNFLTRMPALLHVTCLLVYTPKINMDHQHKMLVHQVLNRDVSLKTANYSATPPPQA